MRVCLLTDKPDHPLLSAASSALIEAQHRVTFLNPDTGNGSPSELVTPDDLADVYLLKAHTPRALVLARFLEAHGARVVNSAAATELCQDRSRIAAVAEGAGLPMPRTRTLDALSEALHGAERPESGYPLMVKSRHSRRADWSPAWTVRPSSGTLPPSGPTSPSSCRSSSRTAVGTTSCG